MIVRHPNQIDTNQRIIFWLAKSGSVALGRPARRFTWQEIDGEPVICYRPRQIATFERRGLGKLVDGRLVLSDEGMKIVQKLRRPPKRISETQLDMGRYWLNDEQMEQIGRLFPSYGPRGDRQHERERLSGVVNALRQGIPFCWSPDVYGPPEAIERLFRRWAKSFALDEIFSALFEERAGKLRHVVSEAMLRRHRTAFHYVSMGCFPIMAPVEEQGA